MVRRLATIAPDLDELLRRQPEDALRAIASAVASLAVDHRPTADPRLDQARAALSAGAYGDGIERSHVETLVEELDHRAWDIQARIADDDATEDEYHAAFADARAASAVFFALDIDAQTAQSSRHTKRRRRWATSRRFAEQSRRSAGSRPPGFVTMGPSDSSVSGRGLISVAPSAEEADRKRLEAVAWALDEAGLLRGAG